MRLRLRSAARLAVVPLAAALVLGACARPGTAATVNGVRITDADVSDVVSDFSQLGLRTDALGALSSMLSATVVLDAASDAGIGVSAEQGVELLDQVAERNGVPTFEYSDAMVDIARSAQLENLEDQDGRDAIAGAWETADVTVNPRFGEFDPMTGLVPTPWPWLVSGTATPTAG